MKINKPLSETNPFLKDPELAEFLNSRSTRTSCGVEGIVKKDIKKDIDIDHTRSRAVYERIKKRLASE